jgi:Squalene/phytoene synthase
MAKHGLSTRPVLKGPKTPEELTSLQNAVFDVASQAHGHLDEARKLVNKISMFSSRPGFMALFPSARSQIFLDDLREADFNPYNPDLLGKLEAPNRLQLQYRLMKLKYTNRI